MCGIVAIFNVKEQTPGKTLRREVRMVFGKLELGLDEGRRQVARIVGRDTQSLSRGIDGILIGDSASNVMVGNSTTLPITIDQMIYHASAVARAVKRALVVCDMPFGSYQVDRKEGVKNAIKIMKESGCDALKLEGGVEIIDTVKGILDAAERWR